MSTKHLRAALVAALALSALTGTAAHAAGPPDDVPPSARAVHAAAGGFTATVDFASLQARDVRGSKCELTVNGTLTFTGTLSGPAEGTTTAVIFAPCAEATTTPPGTFFDVFRFEGTFAGTVDGSPATGELSYAGLTRAGGEIDARIVLDAGEARAVLRADARVAVGGTYAGVARAG